MIELILIENGSDMVYPILDECDSKGHSAFYDSGYHYAVCIDCKKAWTPYKSDMIKIAPCSCTRFKDGLCEHGNSFYDLTPGTRIRRSKS